MAYSDIPPQELSEAIGQMHALRCAVDRQMLGLIAAFDAGQGWQADGATSVVPWLVNALGVSHATAAAWARTARRLEELPAVAGAYGGGRLSADQLAPVLRLATPGNEEELVEAAAGWSAAQARAVARQAAPPPPPPERSALRWWRDGEAGEALHLRGVLRGDAAAVVEQRLEEETARVPGPGPHERKAAEALAGLCAARGRDEAGRAVVVVHAGAEDVREDPALQRLSCDGSVRLVEHAPGGAVVGVGRSTRTPPAWLVQLVRGRDGGCRFPACGRARWTQVHHIRHWSRGGATDLPNLGLLCSHHHRTVHEGGWAIEGDADGELRFIRPDGTVLATGPPPLRPDVRRRILGGDEAA